MMMIICCNSGRVVSHSCSVDGVQYNSLFLYFWNDFEVWKECPDSVLNWSSTKITIHLLKQTGLNNNTPFKHTGGGFTTLFLVHMKPAVLYHRVQHEQGSDAEGLFLMEIREQSSLHSIFIFFQCSRCSTAKKTVNTNRRCYFQLFTFFFFQKSLQISFFALFSTIHNVGLLHRADSE